MENNLDLKLLPGLIILFWLLPAHDFFPFVIFEILMIIFLLIWGSFYFTKQLIKKVFYFIKQCALKNYSQN